jgi:hypothetical protein
MRKSVDIPGLNWRVRSCATEPFDADFLRFELDASAEVLGEWSDWHGCWHWRKLHVAGCSAGFDWERDSYRTIEDTGSGYCLYRLPLNLVSSIEAEQKANILLQYFSLIRAPVHAALSEPEMCSTTLHAVHRRIQGARAVRVDAQAPDWTFVW